MASFLKRVVSRGDDSPDDDRSSRSRSRGRSLSPFHRHKSSANNSSSSLNKSRGRSPSAEGLRRDDVGMEAHDSGDESEGPVVCPSNAFESEDEDSDEEYDSEEEREVAALWGEGDEELVKNTEVSLPLPFAEASRPECSSVPALSHSSTLH